MQLHATDDADSPKRLAVIVDVADWNSSQQAILLARGCATDTAG